MTDVTSSARMQMFAERAEVNEQRNSCPVGYIYHRPTDFQVMTDRQYIGLLLPLPASELVTSR
jgi:hypothetical protein